MHYLEEYLLNISVNTGFDPHQMRYKLLLFLSKNLTLETCDNNDHNREQYCQIIKDSESKEQQSMENSITIILKMMILKGIKKPKIKIARYDKTEKIRKIKNYKNN